ANSRVARLFDLEVVDVDVDVPLYFVARSVFGDLVTDVCGARDTVNGQVRNDVAGRLAAGRERDFASVDDEHGFRVLLALEVLLEVLIPETNARLERGRRRHDLDLAVRLGRSDTPGTSANFHTGEPLRFECDGRIAGRRESGGGGDYGG